MDYLVLFLILFPKEAVVNKAVDALGIEDSNINEWVDSIEAFSKTSKCLNREDFINNHYDIDLEAKGSTRYFITN